MLILGIESSCDETSASVIEDGRKILSNVVASQEMIHSKYGGVVPELASRRHIEMILPVIAKALSDASADLKDIDGIGVTSGPGLIGSLLVGLSCAKSIACSMQIPFVGVNHLRAHLCAINLEEERPDYPSIGLVVSGGHTSLYLLKDEEAISLIGSTRDDAAGEAFDKVAKLLELGYPGGIEIERISRGIDPSYFRFPTPRLEGDSLDFSFSGLKTAVANLVRKIGPKMEMELKARVASAFQEKVARILVARLKEALDRHGLDRAVICGGVAANQRLREVLKSELDENGIRTYVPRKSLCTDNAAMVARAAWPALKGGHADTLRLNAAANLELL